MNRNGPEIAVVGAGVGGLALSIALRQAGIETTIYEQADHFERIGSGINISPNASAALRGLGVMAAIEPHASYPRTWRSYDATNAELINELSFGDSIVDSYGEPFIQMHRGDLHAALAAAVPADTVRLRKQLVGLENRGERTVLRFADDSTAEADLVVGADGIRSRVRAELFGPDQPTYTGRVAYRDVVPSAGLADAGLDDFAKWWGTDRHVVLYYINAGREVYYVTSVPEADWTLESWSAKGDADELRAAFADFPAPVRRVLEQCGQTYKWALCDREPMTSWGDGPVILLGDACHPMTPYMAQGAAMALEDAIILARCLTAPDTSHEAALAAYFHTRSARTAWMQTESRKNTFMRDTKPPAEVYGYNPWTADLLVPAT